MSNKEMTTSTRTGVLDCGSGDNDSSIITYQVEPNLSPHDFIDLLRRSTLAERRPVDDFETMQGMVQNASVLVTARHGPRLVGVARAISDFVFCTYLNDLAVDTAFQRKGIGKRLLQMCHEQAGLHTKLILNAAPAAVGYYPKIGLEKHDSCWMINGIPRTNKTEDEAEAETESP